MLAAAAAYHFLAKVSFDDLEKLEGVQGVFDRNGSFPDVIYIASSHPHGIYTTLDNPEMTAPAIASISDGLYAEYGVRSLLLEGLDEDAVREYNKKGHILLSSGNLSESGKRDDMIISSLLNKHSWRLYPGENKEIQERHYSKRQPIIAIHRRYQQSLQQILTKLNQDGIARPDQRPQLVESAKRGIEHLRLDSQQEIDMYLTHEMVNDLYDLGVNQRNRHVYEQAQLCKSQERSPLIVIFGSAHAKLLLGLFQEGRLGYAALLPKGYKNPQFSDSVSARMASEYAIPPVILKYN